MPKKTIESPFRIINEDSSIKIIFAERLRDRGWAAYFGEVQQLLENNVKNHFELIFFNCIWADPLPLLYFILIANKFSDNGGKVSVYFSKPEKSNETARFLKFLSNEGFLDLLHSITQNISNENGKITKHEINNYKNISAKLEYVDSTLIQAHLFKIESLEEIEEWLEEKLYFLSSILIGKIPEWSIEDSLYKLKNFLLEALHNVYYHAYQKDNGKKYAAVYVRYRKGLIGSNYEEKRKIEYSLEKEANDDARLPKEFLEVREGCIEAIIADLGIGLTNSLAETIKTKKGTIPKRPFPFACEAVFLDGIRKDSVERSLTRSGGLHLIGQLLKENNDFIRGQDEDTWYGDKLPLQRKKTRAYTAALGYEHCGFTVKGLSWLIRLSWTTPTDINESDGWKRWTGDIDKNPILEELKVIEVKIDSRTKNFVIDMRSDMFPIEDITSANRKEISNILLLAKPGLSKNDIIKSIENIASDHSSKFNLIIGDIPCHEAIAYSAALDNLSVHISQVWPKYVSQITLVSKHYSACILIYDSNKNGFKYNENLTDSFFSSAAPQEFSPHKFIRHYVHFLRYHDSYIFWNHILKKHQRDHTYVSGEIKWYPDGTTINGYLDFSQAVTDLLIRQLYRIILERIAGFFECKKCKLFAMDNHVKELVHYYNSTVYQRMKTEKGYNVYIGSIQVSGTTEKISQFNNTSIDAAYIYFFRHNSSGSDAFHLLSWPKQEWFEKNFTNETAHNYKRIGDSAVIAKEGFGFFHMHRFNEQSESHYERTPKETYKEWQEHTPCIMKIGHWCYESNHDLLTVNIWNALRYSFTVYGNLALFLIGNFFKALGIVNQNNLTEKGKIWKDKVPVSKKFLDISHVCSIVYPSHPNTDFVINNLLVALSEEPRKKIIPIKPTRKNRGKSALLISPLILERVKHLIDTSETKSILLFDDALISGRTISEIKNILWDIGAKDIFTISILERRRLPGNPYKSRKDFSYWRLDVPTIGSELSCPICLTLEKVKSFSNNIISTDAYNRITLWEKEWKISSPVSEWTSNGLSPVPILLSQNSKKFDTFKDSTGKYVQKGGDDQRVRLTHSIGLTAYSLELHTMLFRDDYPLKLLEEETNLTESSIVELIATHLILFKDEISPAKKILLLKLLFQTLNKFEEHNKHSSLTGLVFFMQENEILIQVIKELEKSGELDYVILNTDLSIILAYILHTNNEYDYENYIGLLSSKRLLKQQDNRSDLYNNFHLEIYSETGRAHTSPLQKFIENFTTSPATRIRSALNSIDQLRFFLENLDISYFRDSNSDPGETSLRLKRKILDELDSTYELIDKLKQDTPNTQVEPVINKITLLLQSLKRLHNRLFLALSISVINKQGRAVFEDELLKILPENYSDENMNDIRKKYGASFCAEWLKLSLSGKRFPDEDREEVWIVWDAKIKEIVKFLLTNVKHSLDEPIEDYWQYESGKAHMWISITYERRYLIIKLANSTDKKLKEIEDKSKGKGRFFPLDDIGGNVKYEYNKEKNILITSIKIPYAGKAGI